MSNQSTFRKPSGTYHLTYHFNGKTWEFFCSLHTGLRISKEIYDKGGTILSLTYNL